MLLPPGRSRAVALLCAVAAPAALALCCGASETPADLPVPRVLAEPPPRPPAPPSTGSESPAEEPPADAGVDLAALRACPAPRTLVLNTPDGGVVFNNAMTSADAGHIDRAAGVVAALVASEREFRCCFDAWTTRHPGTVATLMLVVPLAPDGAVTGVRVDPARSTFDDALVAACVTETARSLRYPASPTQSTTTVEYPFDVVLRGD
ncbi:MAG: AgmX/PglI C-terminal domain-containing protein [Polyangiaceae bacterium]|nr:AgmX/PglI C-terminal domain-containing protein [Polyangiaceae bacterium]